MNLCCVHTLKTPHDSCVSGDAKCNKHNLRPVFLLNDDTAEVNVKFADVSVSCVYYSSYKTLCASLLNCLQSTDNVVFMLLCEQHRFQTKGKIRGKKYSFYNKNKIKSINKSYGGKLNVIVHKQISQC